MIDTKENKQASRATTNFSLGLHLYVQDMGGTLKIEVSGKKEERELGPEIY
jgi:hypothetical protein